MVVVPSMIDSALTVDVSGASSDVAVASGHPSGEGAFVGSSSDDSFLKEAVSGMRIHEWNSGLKPRVLVASVRSLALIFTRCPEIRPLGVAPLQAPSRESTGELINGIFSFCNDRLASRRRSQMAQVPAPFLPKARRQENDELWPAALGLRVPTRLWASPATSDAARRHALAAEQVHHARGPPAAHTRHPQAWVLAEHKPDEAALCGSWGHAVQLNTSCCRPSARAPCLPHAARLGLRNARAE